MLHKVWNSKGEMPYCFPRSSIKFKGHTVLNITDFDPNWAFPDYRPVAAFKSLRFALFPITRQLKVTVGYHMASYDANFGHQLIFLTFYPRQHDQTKTVKNKWQVLTPFIMSFHSNLALFNVVTPPWSCSFSYLYLRTSCISAKWLCFQHVLKQRWS